MKKTLLSVALLAGAFIGANAELHFQFEGENLEDGATLNYEGYTYVPVLNPNGTPSGMYQLKCDPEIHLISDTNTEVSVQSQSNVAVNLCAGGDCVTGTNNTKPSVNLTANTPLNLQMDWVAQGVNFGEDVEIPAVKVTLRAWNNTESISLTVNLGGITAGVESIGMNNNAVFVSGRNLKYDLNGSSTISVYNLTGKTLLNKNVSGNGSISLSSLPAGVYLYKVAGKTTKTGKFIIK